jgi:hypothetical protein
MISSVTNITTIPFPPVPLYTTELASQTYCTNTVSPQRGCNVSKTQESGTRPSEDRQVKTVLALILAVRSRIFLLQIIYELYHLPPPPPSTHPTISAICLLICYVVYAQNSVIVNIFWVMNESVSYAFAYCLSAENKRYYYYYYYY